MNLPSRASGVSPLVVQTARRNQTTRIRILGRADSSNRDRFKSALRGVDVTSANRVELALGGLEFCDVEAATELVAFATEVSDGDADVAVVDATPWVVAMLTLLDVEAVVAMPAPRSKPPTETWLTSDFAPEQNTALLQLMETLGHDGVPRPSQPVQAGDGRNRDHTAPLAHHRSRSTSAT